MRVFSCSCWLIEIFAFCCVSRVYLAGQEPEQVVHEVGAERQEESAVELCVRQHEVDPVFHLFDEELDVFDGVLVEGEHPLSRWRVLGRPVGSCGFFCRLDSLGVVLFEGQQPRAGVAELLELVVPDLLGVLVLLELRACPHVELVGLADDAFDHFGAARVVHEHPVDQHVRDAVLVVLLEVHLVSLGDFVEEGVPPPSDPPLLHLEVFLFIHLVLVSRSVFGLGSSQLLRLHSAENFRGDDQNRKGFLVLEHEAFVDDFPAFFDGLDLFEVDREDDFFLVEDEDVGVGVFGQVELEVGDFSAADGLRSDLLVLVVEGGVASHELRADPQLVFDLSLVADDLRDRVRAFDEDADVLVEDVFSARESSEVFYDHSEGLGLFIHLHGKS